MEKELSNFAQTPASVIVTTATPTTMLTQLNCLPHIKATPLKCPNSHQPIEFTANGQLIRRISTSNGKYRVCVLSEQTHFTEWWLDFERLSQCAMYLNLFVPLQLEMPTTMKPIVPALQQPIEKATNMRSSELVGQALFDGPEKSFARSQIDYYHSQMAIGDPIRSKRTKRMLQK